MNEVNIEGLDLEDGLRRLRNNKVLYKKLLNNFFTGNMFELIKESAGNNDVKATRAYAHSIKGAAANLGLTLISNTASELDNLLKLESNIITTECLQLLEQLTNLAEKTNVKVKELLL